MTLGARVLHVEDDAGYATMFQMVLEGENLPVQTASTGDQALKALRAGAPPDRHQPAGEAPSRVVVLDLTLPDMHGTQLLAEVRGDPDLHDVPVVVLTGSRDRRDLLRCRDLDASDYIVKPDTLEDFTSAVSRIRRWLSPTAR
jgi:CheY-like chemotaxis protein